LLSLRIGRSWCIRRSVVEESLLGRDKRSQKLVGRLGSFLEIPDNLLMIAQNQQLMRELDVGFFKVADARGGTLTKYYDDSTKPADELRSYLGPTLSFLTKLPGTRVLPFAVVAPSISSMPHRCG
jgi:hypothetical protein